MRPAVIGFAISALAIIVAARYLASSADTLATQMGISLGFAGMILLSAVTTLPEIVVSIAGVRNGAYDMVVGNLFGSNCFNVGILVILDMADGSGPILKTMEPTMRIAALFGILMMGQAILGILHKPQRRVWYLEPHALFLVLTYAAGMFLAYRMGH
jgi:cation:H+ antiporter